MKVKKVIRKAMTIRYSGRSSDFISPSFGFGCLFKCTYCYMRRHLKEGLSVATNTVDILSAIHVHVNKLEIKIPNQTHKKYWTYDISCNEDFALHAKYHEWERIFDYFKNSKKAFGTFATKFVNKELLTYDPNRKIRIRFSMMPQELSDILEPNTSKIVDRIKAVNDFYDAGYDVHLNFSPVIMNPNTKENYKKLFHLINLHVRDDIKKDVLSEVIMLTHNEKMHEYNLEHAPESEKLLWQPDRQEEKTSSYGGKNLRYRRDLKSKYIRLFKKMHNDIIPWNTIRYIF